MRIVNYWPNPRFIDVKSWDDISGCEVVGSNQTFDASTDTFPSFSFKSTSNGAHWLSRIITVPEGVRLVVACAASGPNTSNSTSFDVWTPDSSKVFARCPLNGGVSDEFTAPSRIMLCFRGAAVKDGIRTISNLFVGAKADYQVLVENVFSGFLAGDLAPYD